MSESWDEQQPLLTIELQDETSVPKVFYKGKEIHLKTKVSFEWITDTDEHGNTTYQVNYYDRVGNDPILREYGMKRGQTVE